MITAVVGAYPKPKHLKITDWFNAQRGTDTKNPAQHYINEINKMVNKAEEFFAKATKKIIEDQIECGIDIITDGEVKRENYIHYHCRHLKGIDFNILTEKIASSNLESIEEIELRITEELKYISVDQLIAAPDCGLGHLPRDLTIKKLKTMV